MEDQAEYVHGGEPCPCGHPTCPQSAEALARAAAAASAGPLERPERHQEPEPQEPTDRAAELARLRLLAAAGGTNGQAERLAHLEQRPDHVAGL